MGNIKLARGQSTRILVLNPNSSQAMTDGMKAVIDSVELPSSTEICTYTAPSASPASINDDAGIQASAAAVLADDPRAAAGSWDGILVACFSVHPLVRELLSGDEKGQDGGGGGGGGDPAVIGIFEASILTAMSLAQAGAGHRWGVVTTGAFWEAHLADGVASFLGAAASGSTSASPPPFAGVESTGLNASDFHHGVDPAVVRARLREATLRLLEKGCGGEEGGPAATSVRCVVMGCAGMAGLEATIREAAAERFGDDFGYRQLHVVDAVKAGIMQLDQMIKHQRMRPGSKGT